MRPVEDDIKRGTTIARWLTVGAIAISAGTAGSELTGSEPRAEAVAQPDLLTVLGFHETGGAAPGYVEDRACATCHAAIWTPYQEVGMARSFARPSRAKSIERFEKVFHHELSDRYYSLRWQDDQLIFRREHRDPQGAAFSVYETPVDWVMGSGYHSRVYMTQNAAGELYQLPLAWYAPTPAPGPDPQATTPGAITPGHWGMAPGFDRAAHFGLTRRVRRECMFCHNAYPDVPEGSDADGSVHTFPTNLPEGTGCQRCHGPGANHVRLAFGGERDRDKVRQAIANPGRMEPARRDDVCFGCHLQPSIALTGVRRFGRGDYSFRPGQNLADYLVHVDIVEEGNPQDQRFEINHHPYRLRQSTCYTASPAGALSCLTCHDPHRKVPVAERAVHYRAACQSCHEVDACARPNGPMQSTSPASSTGSNGTPPQPRAGADDQSNCVSCHMSPRRPEDVIQTVMTDHLIRRRPGGHDLLAPLEEGDPTLIDLVHYWPERAPAGALGEVYRTLAMTRVVPTPDAVDYLQKQLAIARPEHRRPWIAWGNSLLSLGHTDAAAAAFEQVLAAHDPETASPADGALARRTRSLLAVARAVQGRVPEAITMLETVADENANDPDTWFNLGRLLNTQGRADDAEKALQKAVSLRPMLPLGWFMLGRIYNNQGRHEEAIEAFEMALALQPALEGVYHEAADTLVALGDHAGAERMLRHGIQVVDDPSKLEEILDGLDEPASVDEDSADTAQAAQPATPKAAFSGRQ